MPSPGMKDLGQHDQTLNMLIGFVEISFFFLAKIPEYRLL